MSLSKSILPFSLALALSLSPGLLRAAENTVSQAALAKPESTVPAPEGLTRQSELEETAAQVEADVPDYFLALVEPDDPDTPPMPPMPPMFFDNDSSGRASHEERIALFRLWRIMNEVKLTDDQVDKFFPLMRKLQRTERDIALERRALLDSLQKEVAKDKPDRAVLQRLMTQVDNNGQRMWRTKKEAIDKLMELLTIEQKARFVIANNEVENDIWQAIARVRAGAFGGQRPGFDREKFREDMHNMRKNLEKMRSELKDRGLPDVNIDLKGLGAEDSSQKKP